MTRIFALILLAAFASTSSAQLVDGPAPEPKPTAEHKKSLTGDDPLAEGDDEASKQDGPAFVGVGLSNISGTQAKQLGLHPGVGLVIRNLVPGSAAEKGGLEVGDILHKFDDQLIITSQQFSVLVSMKKAGDTVKLSFFHQGKPRTIDLKLGARPEREQPQAGQPGRPGLRGDALPLRGQQLEQLTPEQRERLEEAMAQARERLAARGIELELDENGNATFRGEPRIIRGDAEPGEHVRRSEITDDEGNVVGEVIVVESIEIEEPGQE